MSSAAEPALDAARIIARLTQTFPQPARYLVAFSGGLDSSVLLHLLVANRASLLAPLAAVHVDHGLHADAAAWAAYCRTTCDRLGVPLLLRRVNARPARGQSPEAAARDARYGAIAALFGERDMLLSAHHRDDQAETLLLALLRGAGVDGLAAMPAVREWQDGWIGRPLLDASRAALRAWAEANAVAWIEDPSNAELNADRNYLRHVVMPRLRERWPAADARLAHSAALCGEAAAWLGAATAADFAAVATPQPDQLRLDGLCQLGDARARAVLRHWLRLRGLPALPATRLREAVQQLCKARPGAGVEIAWSGLALRRYRDRVWIGVRQLPVGAWPRIAWRGEGLSLGDRRGRVTRTWGPGGIDAGRWSRGTVEVGVRHSGMRCRPAGRGGTRSFKNLVQECGIPPWLRDHVPVVWIDGRVAAIADCCVCDAFAATDGASGWHVHWQRPGPPDWD